MNQVPPYRPEHISSSNTDAPLPLESDVFVHDLLEQSLYELEFHKVVERIAEFAWSDEAKDLLISARPTPDTIWLRAEHERVQECVRLLNLGEPLPMEGFSDIRSMLHKSRIAGAFLSTAELLAVRDVLRASRLVRAFFNTRRDILPTMAEFCQPLHENRLIEKHIADAIDDVGAVKDSASVELARIRRDITDTSNRLRSRLQKLLKKVVEDDVVQEEFITQRDGRFVLPMKTEYKRHIPGIIHSVSQTGATVFLEPAETFEMNNELSLLHNEERREIERILTVLTAEIGEEIEDILRTVGILAKVDACHAKARYANEYDGIKPDISDDNGIILSKAHHPVLVQTHKKAGKSQVVPLSITFDGMDSNGSESFILGHLISGPNAGGKTVALKSIGLNVALALTGIFPFGYCKTNYREIFTAIGDNQSIENDVSTFSSQMLRLREILMNASESSLILVDEICSGTDPQEGAALAVGIIEGFLHRKSCFVVTTHQSSLKSYALTKPGISNASMEFNTDKMESTYRFLSGVPGNSYAFALARRIGTPPMALERAQEYLGNKHSELEESIEIIQQYRREAEKMRREAEDIKQRAEKRKSEYDQKFNEFKAKYNELMRVAKQEAADIVDNANKLVESTIRELREVAKEELEIAKRALEQGISLREPKQPLIASAQNAQHNESADLHIKMHHEHHSHSAASINEKATNEKTSSAAASKTLADVRREFEEEKQKIKLTNAKQEASKVSIGTAPAELQEGDLVTMQGYETAGVIVTIDHDTGDAIVEFDAIKMRTSLISLKRASAKQAKAMKTSSIPVNFDAKTEIDVRGMYSDEAIKSVEQAIAAALTGNVHSLRVIHGKGTGALRQAIQSHLHHHPAVRSHRNGLLTEGGAGVTIVDLK